MNIYPRRFANVRFSEVKFGDIRQYEPRMSEDMTLIYLLEGEMTFAIEGAKSEIMLRKNQVLIVDSYTVYYNTSDRGTVMAGKYLFKPDTVSENDGSGDEKYRIIDLKKSGLNVSEGLLERLSDHLKDPIYIDSGPEYGFLVRSGFYMILGVIFKENFIEDDISSDSQSGQRAVDKVNAVLEYIKEHFNEEITVEEAAGIINVNPNYFCRLFKKATGKTLIHYINRYRILQACREMMKSEASVTDIMYETGFSSYSYFNRIFKQYTGMSPTEYRMRYIKREGNGGKNGKH